MLIINECNGVDSLSLKTQICKGGRLTKQAAYMFGYLVS